MSEKGKGTARDSGADRRMELRESPLMARLLDALEAGEDIGHYGRLVFAMTARHFMSDDSIEELLSEQPGMSADEAKAMLMQVSERDYNPPKRETILEWQAMQNFQICPNPDDPSACNLYRELRFPDGIYERIENFWERKAEEDSR